MSNIDENDRCCRTGNGKRCLCLPYDDGFMIAAQVLSIVAVIISWIWWVGFTISIIALVLHQVVWCCRQSKTGLIANQVISIIAGLCHIFAGIFFLVFRKRSNWCVPFSLESWGDDNYDDYYRYNGCPNRAFAIVAFVDAALWFAAAACLISFVATGRYARWEETLSKPKESPETTASPAAVEMGNVEANEVAAVAVAEPGLTKVDDI
jgi:hypothetical protein